LIDLDGARAAFQGSTDGTVGLEEEFAILEPGTLKLVSRFEELRDAAAATDPGLAQSISGELIASEIEIRSGRGETLATAMAAQRDFRRRLFALATDRDAALGATGTHPWADYREQRIIETEHYQRLNRELQYIVWRNNTFSLHVHVGVRGADRAVRTCDRLRPVLPLLLAISANSPYLDGQDSGLHSARTASFTRLFPRCGIPEPFGDWATFAGYVDFLQRTGSIVEYTQVWWSVRPHTSFGTVEVRICDAQSTAAESEALAAVITGCVLQAAREEAEGLPYVDIPGRLIEENLWRALRWGLDGKLLDLETGAQYPAPEAIERLAEWTAPARAEHGIELAPLTPNGAQRQRRLIEAGVPMDEVFAGATRETRETYSPEVVA
jgi:glutamate---cysteine ligase / carboxylate-amine ligase